MSSFNYLNSLNWRVLLLKKKWISILLMLILLGGFASPSFAASDKEVAEALKMIEKTNNEIDKKIEKAVEKADQLQEDYLIDLRKIAESGKIFDLKKEKTTVLSELKELKQNDKNALKLEEKLVKLDNQIAEEQIKISKEMDEMELEISILTDKMIIAEDKDAKKLAKKLVKLMDELNTKSIQYEEKTVKYTTELAEIIQDIYDETLKMSNETIQKAAEKGVEAECSWKLVRFADQWVWIDPIRVVGRR